MKNNFNLLSSLPKRGVTTISLYVHIRKRPDLASDVPEYRSATYSSQHPAPGRTPGPQRAPLLGPPPSPRCQCHLPESLRSVSNSPPPPPASRLLRSGEHGPEEALALRRHHSPPAPKLTTYWEKRASSSSYCTSASSSCCSISKTKASSSCPPGKFKRAKMQVRLWEHCVETFQGRQQRKARSVRNSAQAVLGKHRFNVTSTPTQALRRMERSRNRPGGVWNPLGPIRTPQSPRVRRVSLAISDTF